MVLTETKEIYCKNCKKKTEHLKCGFGNVGSFVGNARWRCKSCGEEKW